MGEKLNAIFTNDDMKRVIIMDENHIEVDVHHMTKREAARFLRNIIVLNRNDFQLSVIHGYNSGHAIKSMLANNLIHPRVDGVIPARRNKGITRLNVHHA